MIRLSQPTGEIFGKEDANDSEERIVRPAILVHAGSEGKPMEFLSQDGPIKFDAARIQRVVQIHNLKLERLAKEYGGMEKIPMGAYDPILDSHSQASNDNIIGRLTGPLEYQVRDIPKVGKNVPCAVAQPGITFLGKDTVAKAKDGRIYHLSIGIKTDDSLGELSTVVEPAAIGAMLLKHGKHKTDNGGSKMSAELKRMQAHTDRLTKLSQMKKEMTQMVAKTTSTQEEFKLSAKKGEITHRLGALCQAAKMSPAEFKKVTEGDRLTKLAKMDPEMLDVALSVFESRDAGSLVRLGQVGSTSAPDAMTFGKSAIEMKNKAEAMRLAAETKKDMIRMSGGKRLFGEDKSDPDHAEHSHEMASGPVEERIAPSKDEHAVPGQAGDEQQMAHHLEMMGKHLAAGDIEGAKEVHAKMASMKHGMKHMSEYSGDVKSEDYKAQMAAHQSQLDELKTQMSRMAGMVEEMMGAEQEEGKHFGEISKEHGAVEQA